MALSTNKHALTVKKTINVSKDNNTKIIIEVTTDLELDVHNRSFDSSALDDLADDLVETIKNDPSIDSGVIKPI